jgi:hypothetical protein
MAASFGRLHSVAEAVPFDRIHLDDQPGSGQTGVGVQVRAAGIRQRLVPHRLVEHRADREHITQIAFDGGAAARQNVTQRTSGEGAVGGMTLLQGCD